MSKADDRQVRRANECHRFHNWHEPGLCPDCFNAALSEARQGVAKSGALMIIGLAQDLFAAQAALGDAREEGRREGMEAFTAEAQESVDVARREAFEEAIRKFEQAAPSWARTEAIEIMRALASQPPNDTAWRAGAPTDAEVDQHDGLWALDYGGAQWWIYDIQWSQDSRIEGMKRIRPVTRDLMPAPWPKGESDAEV